MQERRRQPRLWLDPEERLDTQESWGSLEPLTRETSMLCSHMIMPTIGIIIVSTAVGAGDAVTQMVFPHVAGSAGKVTHIRRRTTFVCIRADIKRTASAGGT